MYNMSPAVSVQLIALGATSFQKSGYSVVLCPNTSTLVVLLILGSISFTAGCVNAAPVHGYIHELVSGGANQTVLLPTNCTVQCQHQRLKSHTHTTHTHTDRTYCSTDPVYEVGQADSDITVRHTPYEQVTTFPEVPTRY